MYPIAENSEKLIFYIENNIECRLNCDYEELYLSNNNWTTLPEWFGNILDDTPYIIERLSVSNNNLAVLPNSIGKFRGLKSLQVSENKLHTLPDTIGNLQSLERLFAERNQLTTLPDTIGNLENLTLLFLYENKLHTLPDTFPNLQNLKILLLNRNNLLFLSDSILQANLSMFSIRNNYLAKENLVMFDVPTISTKCFFPQKEFIWPTSEGRGGVSELEKRINIKILLQNDYDCDHWDRFVYKWLQEFSPKGKENLSFVPR